MESINTNMAAASRRAAQCLCGAPFTQMTLLGDLWFPRCCAACDAAMRSCRVEHHVRTEREVRDANIASEIPDLYRMLAMQTIESTLSPTPAFPAREWAFCEGWFPDDYPIKKGLLFVGPSGSYKTTIACALLIRHHLETGKSIMFLPALDFGDAATQRGRGDTAAARNKSQAILDRAATASMLVLDDLGKQGQTAAIDRAMKTLIERRTSRLLPTIITTQNTAAEVEAGLTSADAATGRAIVRRLRDYHLALTFLNQTESKP